MSGTNQPKTVKGWGRSPSTFVTRSLCPHRQQRDAERLNLELRMRAVDSADKPVAVVDDPPRIVLQFRSTPGSSNAQWRRKSRARDAFSD